MNKCKFLILRENLNWFLQPYIKYTSEIRNSMLLKAQNVNCFILKFWTFGIFWLNFKQTETIFLTLYFYCFLLVFQEFRKENCLKRNKQWKCRDLLNGEIKLVQIEFSALSNQKFLFVFMYAWVVWVTWTRCIEASYCYEFVNIARKICKYYLFLCYNTSDTLRIYIFWKKLRNFS